MTNSKKVTDDIRAEDENIHRLVTLQKYEEDDPLALFKGLAWCAIPAAFFWALIFWWLI